MNVTRSVVCAALFAVTPAVVAACGGSATIPGSPSSPPSASNSAPSVPVATAPTSPGTPSSCAPLTCQAAGVACGPTGDGCGNLLACGDCAAPQFCGGGGPGQCGGDTATATGGAAPIAVAISAGLYSTCALLSDGTVRCWGYNAYGQLGDGTNDNAATPVPVQGLTGATSIDDWDGYHACAVLSTGQARCWGSGYGGDLGNGAGIDSNAIKAVSTLDHVASISAGPNDTCAIQGGSLWCWGEDGYGDLGPGTGSSVPVQVAGLTNVVAVTAASDTCVLLADGTVECWGDNSSGQIGNGTVGALLSPVNAPTPVAGLSGARAIAGGYGDACAIVAGGAVMCWGANQDGQVGNGTVLTSAPGTSTGVATPTAVAGLTGVTSIALSAYYACAVLADKTVACWGDNEDGTLGDGSTTNSPVPVPVTGLTNVVAVSAGTEHACALIEGGTIACWGLDTQSELGTAQVNGTCGGAPCSTTPVVITW